MSIYNIYRGFHPILPVIFSVPDLTDPKIGTGSAGELRFFFLASGSADG
jgi:hypothetical protein